MAGVAAVGSGVASLAGSLISSNAASKAASQEAAASQAAAQLQQQRYQDAQKNLQPFITAGTNNLPAYGSYYATTQDALGNAFNNAQSAADKVGTETQAQLEATPGYQFSLSQGLQGTQAAAAARGLGVSGAAMKGASNFATGLANNTYQNVFNQQNQNYQNQANQFNLKNSGQQTIFNQLSQPVQTAATAASNLGSIGQGTGATQGGLIQGAGQQQGAGTTTSANNISSGLGSLGQQGYNYLALNNYLNNGSGGNNASATAGANDTFMTGKQ